MTIETGQWFERPDGPRWWFDSGATPLDFAYTGAMGDNPAWEQLHSPADLADWLAPRFSTLDGSPSERDLVDALMLRAALARMVTALGFNAPVQATDIDIVNLVAATPDIPPVLPGGSRQAGRSTARTAQALSAMARQSIEIFAEEAADRIRECSADGCGLIFYDSSRSNNRRWCSMQRCGNRAKVRAHRSRTRTA